MGWKEYYRPETRPILLKDNLPFYKKAIDRLRVSPKFLPHSQIQTFALAGFYPDPSADTPKNFVNFCQSIHPHSSDRYLVFDMNSEPFLRYPRQNMVNLPNTVFTQARFEALPVPKHSVDIILADYTINFMSPQQVGQLSRSLKNALSPNGLLLAMVSDPAIPFIESITKTRHHRVKYHVWNPTSLAAALTDLKPVFSSNCGSNSLSSLLGYSQPESAWMRDDCKGDLILSAA
jgi:hypothetical protein